MVTQETGFEYCENFGISTLVKNKEINGKVYNDYGRTMSLGGLTDGVLNYELCGAFATIVTALTDDFINPLINSIGGAEIKGQLAIWGGQYLNWGHFVTAVINFLIMAFILFLMIKGVNKLMEVGKKKKEEAAAPIKTDETILLEEIRDILKKNK